MNILSLFLMGLILFLIISANTDLQNLLVGASVSLIVAVIASFYVAPGLHWLNPVRWFWFLVYVPVFIWEMIRANIQIARVVVMPSLPIQPGILQYKTSLKSDISRMLLTSSITLTPGTLSVDFNGDVLDIHCVNLDRVTPQDIQKFEKYIKRISE